MDASMTPALVPGESTIPTSRPARVRLSDAQRRSLSRRQNARRALVAAGFLLPDMIFFSVFLLLPVIVVIRQSFYTGGLLSPEVFAGIKNWTDLPADPVAVQSIQNSIRYALMAIPIGLLMGFGLALFLQQIKRGSGTFRALLYFPILAPTVIVGLIWLFLTAPDFGLFNMALRFFGQPQQTFLATPDLAMPMIVVLEVWRAVGFWALFFLASLIGLPRELYEAAHLDGANVVQRFRYLTFPLLRRGILFALVLAVIYNLQIFDSVFVMTNGGPFNTTATVVWYIYNSLFNYNRIGFGAAISLVLLAMIMALSLILMRLLRDQEKAA